MHEVSSEKIVQILGSCDRRSVMAAFQELQQMGPEGETLLLAVLEEEMPRQASQTRRLSWAAGLLAVLSLVGIAVSLFFGPSGWFLAAGVVAMVALSVAVSLAARLAEGSTPTRRQRDAAAGLSALWETVEDRRSIGPLLELACFWVPATPAADAAFAALQRLLPQLRAADMGPLSEKQQQALIGLVCQAWRARGEAWCGARDHPRVLLYVAVLQAVGVLRLVTAVPTLRKLARMRQPTENHRRVREAAQECLYALKAAGREGV